MKPLSGRRAILFARIDAVAHFFEPVMFGLSLAGGMYLTLRQCGDLVLIDRRGGSRGEATTTGLALLVGVTLITASLIFFHRKGRMVRQRLAATAVALAFFGIGYAREMRAAPQGALFGLATLAPSASFVEDYPGRPKVAYQVNRWGLRGGDFEEAKGAGVARVAIVGDSFVFGSGVEEDGTLAAQLGARLAERFPGARLQVVNLGIPGNNLRSHLAAARVAEEKLGADVVVMCLTLPNDLSEWDTQVERAEHAKVGGFSLASFLLGRRAATLLWGERRLARDVTEEGVVFLEQEAARFATEWGAAGSRPLVVFAYSFADPRVSAALRRIPGATVVPPFRWDEAHFIPGDGHPTAAGNQAFARRIAAAFQGSWVGAGEP